MISKRLRIFLGSFIVSLSSLLLLSAPRVFAATLTWTGGTNNLFSTGANWTGGVAPTNGDTIVFDNAAVVTNSSPSNDIVGLSVVSVQFINTGLGGVHAVAATTPITVTSTVEQMASVTSANVDKMENGFILGANVRVTGVSLGSSSPSLLTNVNLNGFALTFTDPTSPYIMAQNIPITGAGTVNYSAPNSDFQIYLPNTYSGTTNIDADNSILSVSTPYNGVFGTSAINLAASGSLSFNLANSDNSTSLSNVISLSDTGSTTSTNWTGIHFICGGTCSSAIGISVPNIVLLGNSLLSASDAFFTINVTGITANGHCVEYTDSTGTYTGGTAPAAFPGGPNACAVASAVTTVPPKAPNTGFQLATSHPLITMLSTITLTTAIVFIARRYNKISN